MGHQCVAETIRPIAHLEKQYPGPQVEKMVLDYLNRSAKKHAEGRATWDKKIDEFAYKFFESLWKPFGESSWLEQVDFSWIISTGVRAYLPPSDLANVTEEEFNQVVGKATLLGFDSCRYYNWGSYAMKKIVSGKKTQSKVRDSIDSAREDLLKQNIQTPEEFVSSWVKATLGKLGGEASQVLPAPTAVQLFNEMITSGGGLPLWLAQPGGGPGGLTATVGQEICNAVAETYKMDASMLSMGAWGPMGGKGCGGYGSSPY